MPLKGLIVEVKGVELKEMFAKAGVSCRERLLEVRSERFKAEQEGPQKAPVESLSPAMRGAGEQILKATHDRILRTYDDEIARVERLERRSRFLVEHVVTEETYHIEVADLDDAGVFA